jgi:hypothetical protein
MKHGYTNLHLQATVKAWNGNVINQYQEIQECAFCWQSDVDSVLGF